MGLLAFKIW